MHGSKGGLPNVKQSTMFDTFDDSERVKPEQLARSTDPSTSHEAAEQLIQTGSASNQRNACLAVLRQQDGLTSAEVGQRLGGGYNARFVAARRLPDLQKLKLVHKGEARVCTANGTKAVTWWVV